MMVTPLNRGSKLLRLNGPLLKGGGPSTRLRFFLVGAMLAGRLAAAEPVITAIGDSFTAGNTGFDDAACHQPLHSYPSQLSELTKVSVINWGFSGWTSIQVKEQWLHMATPTQKAGVVIMAVGTNNLKNTDSSVLVSDVRAVLESLTSRPKKFILLLHPHAGTDYSDEKKALIVRYHQVLQKTFPEYAIDLWDFHVDDRGVIEPAYRRHNIDGTLDGLHPSSLWYTEVARRVAERIQAMDAAR